jgi:hypothetical protein
MNTSSKTEEYALLKVITEKSIDVVGELEQTISNQEELLYNTHHSQIDHDILRIENTIARTKFQLNYIREVTRADQPWQLVFHLVKTNEDGSETVIKKRLHSCLSVPLKDQMKANEDQAYFHNKLDPKRTLHSIFTTRGARLHRLSKGLDDQVNLNDFTWEMLEEEPLTLTWNHKKTTSSRTRPTKAIELPSIKEDDQVVADTEPVITGSESDLIVEPGTDLDIHADHWPSFTHLIPFKELVIHFSAEQLAHFHAAPYTNFVIHGAAGSGKTQWALLRPLVLSLGLDEGISVSNLEVDSFEPLPVESFLGLAQSPPLVASLKALLSSYPEAPISNMKVASWSDIQSDILDSLYEAGFEPDFDQIERFESDNQNNPIGKLKVAKLTESFITYKIYRSLHNDLNKVEQYKEQYCDPYTTDIKSLSPNTSLRLAKEKAHYQDYLSDQKLFSIERLKTIWEAVHADLSVSSASLELTYDFDNFWLWLTHHAVKFLRLFPDQASRKFTPRLNEVLRNLDHRSLTLDSSDDAYNHVISGKDFDFIIYYLLQAQNSVSDEEMHIKVFPEHLSKLRHIFIDEYQDFTGVQDLIISSMKGAQCSMTKVGDPYQRIAVYDGAVPKDHVEKLFFNTNYRQTHHLGRFSSLFHKDFQSGGDIELRAKQESDEHPFKVSDDFKSFIDLLKGDLDNKHYRSTAVIVKTMEEAKELNHHLSKSLSSTVIQTEMSHSNELDQNVIHIATPRMTKGLEFDSTYVIGVYNYETTLSQSEANQLYVAFTRARLKMGVSTRSFQFDQSISQAVQAPLKLAEFLKNHLQ